MFCQQKPKQDRQMDKVTHMWRSKPVFRGTHVTLAKAKRGKTMDKQSDLYVALWTNNLRNACGPSKNKVAKADSDPYMAATKILIVYLFKTAANTWFHVTPAKRRNFS